MVSARPQRGSSVWSQRCRTQQRRSRLVDGLIDAFGTQPHARLLGKTSAQVAADLLRTPSLRQKLGHHQSERGNGFETSPVMPGSSCGRVAVGVERAVNTGRGRVAAQLPRDRRGRPPQPARDLSDAQARVAKVRELNPLVLRQEPRADLAHGQPFEGRHEADQLSASIDLVAPRPVVGRRAGDADLTGCASDAPPPLAQAHELLTLGRQRTPPRPLLHTTRRRQHNLTISEVLRPLLETTQLNIDPLVGHWSSLLAVGVRPRSRSLSR